jgi:hypothetical protein
MKRAFTAAVAAVVFAGALAHGAGQAPAANAVAGMWSVTVANRTEPLRLQLIIEGSTVRGAFDGSAIVGEFKNGQLTFGGAASYAAWRAGTIGGEDAPMMYPTIATAKVSETGQLKGWTDVYIRGYGPQAIKRSTWTAVRTSAK